jgi:hypothetical protein
MVGLRLQPRLDLDKDEALLGVVVTNILIAVSPFF